MNRSQTAVLVATFAAFMAMGAAPWRSLPDCVNGTWSGITPVDELGSPTGPADPADWGCVDGTGTAAVPLRNLDIPPIPPPTEFCLYPPAPNPAFTATRLTLAVPRAGGIRVAIYAKKGHGPHNARLVRTLLDGTVAAGLYEFVWDGRDEEGVRLPADLYRAVMETEAGAVCGDIELR
jgi:FlgD Ig-like domain